MLYSDPVTQGDDDSTVWRKLCHAKQNSGPVGQPPVNTIPPVVMGNYWTGEELSVSNGSWINDPVLFTYQWFTGASPLIGETGSTYTVQGSAMGAPVNCVVTASNPFGSTPSSSNSLSDPLDGVSMRMNWTTTYGGAFLRPMWQDVARTMLVTTEGEAVATMGADSLEFIPEQATETQKGIMFRETDGTPYITMDGIDDCYPIGISGDQVTLSALFRSIPASFNGFWGLAEMSGPGNPGDRWGLFASGTTQWHNDPFPDSVRLNGTPLVSPFDMGTVTDWMVVTWLTHLPDIARTRSLFQLQDVIFGNCDAIAMCMYDGVPTAPQIAQVEAFYTSLIPT